MNTKFKIVHVVNDFCIGGVSAIVHKLCNELNRELFEVHCIILGEDLKYLEQHPLEPHVCIHYSRIKLIDGYTLKDYFLSSLLPRRYNIGLNGLKGLIKSIKPDIIHAHVLPRELPLIKNASKSLPAKLIYTDHLVRVDFNSLSGIKKIGWSNALKRLYSGYRVISVSSTVHHNNFEAGVITYNNKPIIISNKIDNAPVFKTNYSAHSEELTIVYVARLSEVKGHRDLLTAISWIKDQFKVKLKLIGPGDLYNDISIFIARNNLHSFVELMGARSDVQELLVEADIAVFPSYKEGLPIALLEKMRAGMPIIASNIPELADVLDDGENALLFPVGDQQALTEKLVTLISDETLRCRLGTKARATFLNQYCGNIVHDYENYYLSLIN